LQLEIFIFVPKNDLLISSMVILLINSRRIKRVFVPKYKK
jgi:hypothetical protein